MKQEIYIYFNFFLFLIIISLFYKYMKHKFYVNIHYYISLLNVIINLFILRFCLSYLLLVYFINT